MRFIVREDNAYNFETSMSDNIEKIPLEKTKIKSIVESLLFVNERPLNIEELRDVLDSDKKDIEAATEELIQEYKRHGSGVCIVKVAGGYQMCSLPDNEGWVKKMYQERSKQKLSIPALETLAIIAYKQPITRMEIESIRGVNIDGVVKHLDDLGLIKTEGRKEVPGRPFLYITTRKFLEYFGLNHLKDLPKLEEFVALAEHENAAQTSPQAGSIKIENNIEDDMSENNAIANSNNAAQGKNKEEVTQ